MLSYQVLKQKTTLLLLIVFAAFSANAQVVKRVQPKWWFGESVGVNFNTYRGTTQVLNKNLSVPTAFHKGDGEKLYASLLTEYRPNKTVGIMLNVAYDNRGGQFKEVMAPCNCPANLSTNLAYVSIEPALRIAPFSNAFYLFAGPTISINVSKSFTYTQEKQADVNADFDNIRKTVVSGQVGAGIDIPLSAKTSSTQMSLSPFVSFQTDMGQSPRKTESWAVHTLRTGIALKFGTKKSAAAMVLPPVVTTVTNTIVTPAVKDVQFSVRGPKAVPLSRQVKETFPLRNSVFFDMGSTEIPNRYVMLNQSQASNFKESQLQEEQPGNLNNGRSARQLAVYYNILNIMGDRLRSNPNSSIALAGASDKNPTEGKLLAENVKNYLVNNYGINGSRITTEGRDKPVIASEQPGATKDLALLREGDRRVDIESTSSDLMMQVGGVTSPFMKPVQIMALQSDPMDSHVIFTNAGANELLNSWSVSLTDEQGKVQSFGPYTRDIASLPGKNILGNNTQGNYKVVMTGETKAGSKVQKESFVSLVKTNSTLQDGLRYSILFDFDRSKSIAAYENFLTDVVAPLIPENGTVIIHGHTDIIGEEKYNLNLSHERANGAQQIIERALAKAGKRGVKFESYGFGEDENMAPFENNFVEKRFYNRTVIIDIVGNK
jgi:outer membrane protein OmpA-like peptidoglycan-associated protein